MIHVTSQEQAGPRGLVSASAAGLLLIREQAVAADKDSLCAVVVYWAHTLRLDPDLGSSRVVPANEAKVWEIAYW